MGYEVDVIGLGAESKIGDAIALRWSNLHGKRNEQKVVLINGGLRIQVKMSSTTSQITKRQKPQTL